MKALLALERVRLLRGHSVWLGAGVGLLIALAGVSARYQSGQLGALEASVDLGLAHCLAYLLPYLFCAGMISEEISGRTLAFLTSRPVPRSQIVFAKWIVGSASCAGVLLATSLALHVAGNVTEPQRLLSALPAALGGGAALSLQAACYVSLGLGYGVLLPGATSALFAFHLLLIEAALSLSPGPLRLFSLAHHAAELAGLPRHGLLSEGVRTLAKPAHLTILLVVCFGLLALAAAVFQRSEYQENGQD